MAALKINELSVGDWVQYRGIICPICSIYKEVNATPDEVALGSKDIFLGVVPVSKLRPIHITTEMLKKNGLEYIDDGNDAVLFLCCDMFWARLCVGDTFWQVGIHSEDKLDAVVCNIKHVHQLQHALRLAGLDKEIVMPNK